MPYKTHGDLLHSYSLYTHLQTTHPSLVPQEAILSPWKSTAVTLDAILVALLRPFCLRPSFSCAECMMLTGFCDDPLPVHRVSHTMILPSRLPDTITPAGIYFIKFWEHENRPNKDYYNESTAGAEASVEALKLQCIQSNTTSV